MRWTVDNIYQLKNKVKIWSVSCKIVEEIIKYKYK